MLKNSRNTVNKVLHFNLFNVEMAIIVSFLRFMLWGVQD